MFELKVRRKALRYIDRLEAKRKNAIKEALSLLKSDPVPVRRIDVTKLKGNDDQGLLGCQSGASGLFHRFKPAS